jgi:type IV pilus assembly protein PilA
MSSFIAKLQKRLAKEESGFTLIELLIVLVIIGILLAIAVPSYLGFKTRAEQRAAQANVRSAVPAVEAYYADNGTYVGMDAAALALIDAGVQVTVGAAPTATSYCISNTQGGSTYRKVGPAGTIVAGAAC